MTAIDNCLAASRSEQVHVPIGADEAHKNHRLILAADHQLQGNIPLKQQPGS
jgi:hypothetical protein